MEGQPTNGSRIVQIERRTFMKGAALSALAFTIGSAEVLLTPAEARAQGVPLKVLSADEAAAFEALGDTLLPGAKNAGIVNYVDLQLSVGPGDCLLTARTVGVPSPYAGFYHGALAALDQASLAQHKAKFSVLTPEQRHAFVDQMRQSNPDSWQGPPAPFVYFLTRSDAVDVYYGTVEGFERLGVPYMPHILPKRKW